MKRLLAGLSLALLVFTVPHTAHAYSKLVSVPLSWRTSVPNSGTTATYVDSSFVRNAAGVENSAQHSDTTAAFVPSDFLLAPGGTALPSDTTAVFTFFFSKSNSSAITSGSDTVVTTLQYSLDGVNWVSTIGGQSSLTLLENSTTDSYFVSFKTVCAAAGATLGLATLPPISAANPALNSNSIYNALFARLIVRGDWTGEFYAFLRGWMDRGSGLQ